MDNLLKMEVEKFEKNFKDLRDLYNQYLCDHISDEIQIVWIKHSIRRFFIHHKNTSPSYEDLVKFNKEIEEDLLKYV